MIVALEKLYAQENNASVRQQFEYALHLLSALPTQNDQAQRQRG